MRVSSAVDLTSEQDVAEQDVAAEAAAAAGAAAETDRGGTSVPALFDTYSKCNDALQTGQVDAVAAGNSIFSGIAAKSGVPSKSSTPRSSPSPVNHGVCIVRYVVIAPCSSALSASASSTACASL